MDTSGARAERLHQRVLERIPWYVNGTLEAAERQTVDDHVAGCARCRAELAAERELAQAVKDTEAVAPSPHPAQLARLLARIDAHEATADALEEVDEIDDQEDGERADVPAARPRPWRRLAALFEPTPHRLRQLLVAELAAILTLAAALAWHLQPARTVATAPDAAHIYSTLTGEGEPPVVAKPGKVLLHLVFRKDAKVGRFEQILAEVHGRIISGPSDGLYVIEVPAGPHDEMLDLVLAHLREKPEVDIATRYAGAGER